MSTCLSCGNDRPCCCGPPVEVGEDVFDGPWKSVETGGRVLNHDHQKTNEDVSDPENYQLGYKDLCKPNSVRTLVGDCFDIMQDWEDDSVDLVFCSPPYEAARTYGMRYNLKNQNWVDWAFKRYMECVRVSRGLVAWVVEGQTRQFRWSATPALLMADLHRAGVKLRKPPVFRRVGIPGSGGPDWWRNDYEFIVCSSKGKLPWSDNTATGHPPKWNPGGTPSHRMRNGRRVQKKHTKHDADGKRVQGYNPPKLANPGNVVECVVGGGQMGSPFAHENEAPFPESLAESFIKSFCPPGGVVVDPFCGSGTTMAVAERLGRQSIGIDIRVSQIVTCHKRLGNGFTVMKWAN